MASYPFGTASLDQPVALIENGDNSMSVFANVGGQLQAARIKPDTKPDPFEQFTRQAVPAAGGAVAARADDDQRVGVFYRDGDGRLMLLAQTKNGLGAWNAPVNPCGALMTGDPVIGRNADGRLEVYFVGTNGALWHIWSDNAGLEDWGCDQFGGGDIRDIAVATSADGRQVLFHTNNSGELWVIQQTGPNGYWDGFANPFNGVTGPLAAAPAKPLPIMAVFGAHAAGADNVLSFSQQDGNRTWSASAELPYDETARPNTDPAIRPVLLPGPGGLLVAVVVHNGTLWVLEQPSDPSVRFGAWNTVVCEQGAAIVKPIAAAFAGPYLNVVAGDKSNGLIHIRYTWA
ncbi:hypothetical protein ACFYU9_05800 [Streptomyces sp. NPDC004327]|uniref:hypothetical protein n=1 Tax=unclassified Streptomyces TaxID=2593676 RepID=UPI00368BBC47